MKRSPKAVAKAKEVAYLASLVKKIVLARDGYRCWYCGGKEDLQAAHILSVGASNRLRFEPFNVVTMCLKDHIFGWHRDPAKYIVALEVKFPGRYDALQIMARTAPKIDYKLLKIVLELGCASVKGARRESVNTVAAVGKFGGRGHLHSTQGEE